MNCTKCNEIMKERKSFAGLSFLGCKTWRKCGRHSLEGSFISDAEWQKLITTEQTQQQLEEQQRATERAEHKENVTLALQAMLIKYGDVIRKVRMQDDDCHGNGQIDFFLSKDDLKQANDFPEPCIEFIKKDDGLVVRLIDYASVYGIDWFSGDDEDNEEDM